jgi:hypothetical protein
VEVVGEEAGEGGGEEPEARAAAEEEAGPGDQCRDDAGGEADGGGVAVHRHAPLDAAHEGQDGDRVGGER